MREVITKLYQFHELSDDAKEKAIEWYSQDYPCYEWWEFVYEDAKNIGIKITEFDIYPCYCKISWLESEVTVANNILKEHGEGCDTHQAARIFLGYYPQISDDEELTDEIENTRESAIEDFQIDLQNAYAGMLYKEYEYLTSREHIIEMITINEYEFTEEGKRA